MFSGAIENGGKFGNFIGFFCSIAVSGTQLRSKKANAFWNIFIRTGVILLVKCRFNFSGYFI